MDSESIQLMVTSPPYYNARDYSQWKNIDEYLEDMKQIIKESWRVLDNHRVWVFNVGDIFGNPNNKTSSVWGKQRIPLGAYFTTIFEEEGFTFVDDFIWDKGEVQSQRQKNANNPYPMYQYPVNSYEHILIFHKHRLDTTKFPCPRCGSLNVNGNTQSEPGLQSWECKNNDCPERSASNRGKRFSLKTNMTQSSELRNLENKIDEDFVKKWRKDIIPFSPVIKINSKGENTLGHTAPFPEDIPEYAVRMFTYKGEKVLDPFAGSFTAPKVAAKLGRIGIGVELNKKMFGKDIKKHLEKIDNSLFDHPTTWNEFSILKEKKVNRQK
jgi:DNA modification methylase